MKASGRELQSQLEKNGTPNRFPKVLPAKKVEWERMQSMDTRTLLASLCIQGAREKWNATVEDICDEGMNIGDLLHKLRTVERSINPGTDAKVILLPGASIMSECTLMSDSELLRVVTQRAKLFVDFFMNDKYGDTSLEEALLLYAEFHILEGQPVEWSNEHSFKCNCPHFCQWASCHHGLLCTMVCKPSLVVPPQYVGLGVHSRGKRGRPRRGDQGEGEGEESGGCRDRVQQTKGYTVPKTAAQLETVDSEDDVQPAPRGANKVVKCVAEVNVS